MATFTLKYVMIIFGLYIGCNIIYSHVQKNKTKMKRTTLTDVSFKSKNQALVLYQFPSQKSFTVLIFSGDIHTFFSKTHYEGMVEGDECTGVQPKEF